MSAIELDLSTEEREALTEFANLGDRDEPFKFVGRTEILNDITNQLALIRKKNKSFSNARLIQGPPGSGKTAILRELAKFELVLPVHLSGQKLSNPAAVATAFIRSCGFDESLLGKSHQRNVSGRLGGRWIGIEGSYGSLDKTPLEHLNDGIPVLELIDDYVRLPENTIFLVLIDEAQRIEVTPGHKVNTVGVALGDGDTGHMKTMTVFGGLSDTLRTLKSVGLSPRMTQGGKHFLGALESSTVEDLLFTFFNHEPFGLHRLPEHHKRDLVNRIMTASECYPRHIHGYMRGIALAWSHRQTGHTLDALLEPGHEIRLDYYSNELIDLEHIDPYIQALSKAALGYGERFSIKDVERIGRTEYNLSPEQLQQGHRNAIHHGLIEIDRDRPGSEQALHIPIPSLATYMATGFDHDKTLELLNGNDQGLGS